MKSKPVSSRPLLFSEHTIRDLTLKNRIVVSPMCQYASHDGSPVDWHYGHLGRYAIGGAGLVFYEETAVEARGRKTYACAGLYRDEQVPEFKRVAQFLSDLGAVPAMQLGHAGRKASVKSAMHDWAPLDGTDADNGQPPWQGVSSSALPAAVGKHIPKAMDREDMDVVIQAFVDATRRSYEAGFKVLEIHGAHGYLLHQFLSPLSNLRTDEYGGDRNNRMRFCLEVTEALRAAWPQSLPLFYRVSAIDGQGGIWNMDDTVQLSRALASRGVDLVDCSSGGITGDSAMPGLKPGPGNQVAFAQRVREEAGVASMAVGFITKAAQAEAILRAGQADLIAMARELMYHADWPVHAARELGVDDAFNLFPPSYSHRLVRRELALDAN